MTEFRQFWTRDEPKKPKELEETKDLTKSEKRTEPKNLMVPIEHTKLNSHPYAYVNLTSASTHTPHPHPILFLRNSDTAAIFFNFIITIITTS